MGVGVVSVVAVVAVEPVDSDLCQDFPERQYFLTGGPSFPLEERRLGEGSYDQRSLA